MNERKSHWSEDGQIFFLDGWGWGVAPDGRTVCLNTEEELLRKDKLNETGSQDNQGRPDQA